MNIKASNGAEISIECLTTFDQFRVLEQEWEELSADQVSTIFLSYLWLQEWWHVYGTEYQIWTLIAREEGKLIGIMPLILSRELFGIQRLMFMGVGEVTPNHLDIIADPEKRNQVFEAFIAYLCQPATKWDVLELDKIPGDNLSVDLLKSALNSQGLSTKTEISATCPYIELPGSFEDYISSRGSTTRESYRRAKRRIEKDFPTVCCGLVDTPEEIDRVMGALIHLHQKRWLQKGYQGSFSNQEFIGFHRTVALKALECNQLRLYYLQINADIIAVYYCYRIADSVQFYLGGFDEQFSKYSPGILINAFAIEQAILEGAKHFDFLEGEERYKQHWMTDSRENIVLWVFRPNWRGQLARMNWGIRSAIINTARRFLSQEIRVSIRQILQRLHISI
jgi:CelD/BcsL family acetyltransferase involved in cellulose biosynthesis